MRPSASRASLQRHDTRRSRAKGAAAKEAGYAPGYRAIELAGHGAPFGFVGGIDLSQSKVQTKSGGGIDFVNPGGGVNVGLSAEVSNVIGQAKSADQRGVVTFGGGGIRAFTALRYFPQHNFYQHEVRFNAAHPISPSGSFVYGLSGGTSFGETNVGLRFFSLGGPLRLGAYGPNELIGSDYALLSAGYLRDVWKLPPLVGDRVSIIGMAQAGKIRGDSSHTGVPVSGTGLFVARTWLGPVYLGHGHAEGGSDSFYLYVGRTF